LWRRTVVYLKGAGWWILDVFEGYGDALWQTQWLFHPSCLVQEDQEGNLQVDLGNGAARARVQGYFSRQGQWDLVRGQLSPEVRGWYSPAYNQKLAATSARWTQRHSGPFYNVWWIGPVELSEMALQARWVKGESGALEDQRWVVESGTRSWELRFEQGLPVVELSGSVTPVGGQDE
jgi:hypothetical protein